MSALQAAIASGEITERALMGLQGMVEATNRNAVDNIRIRSDIINSMVGSAQNLAQTKIDADYKAEMLKLNARELEIRALDNQSDAGIRTLAANIDLTRAQTELERVKALQNKEDKIEKMKPYLSALDKSIMENNNYIKTEEARIDSEIEHLETRLYGRKGGAGIPEIPGMSRRQIDLDLRNPNGISAQIKSLRDKKNKDIQAKRLEIERLQMERASVADGAEPSLVQFNRNTNSQDQQLPRSTPGSLQESLEMNNIQPVNEQNPLLPNIEVPSEENPKIKVLQSEIDKAAERLRQEQEQQGQIPSVELRNDISIKESDNFAMSRIYDKQTPTGEAVEYHQDLSPEGRKMLSQRKQRYENAFLASFASSKVYDPNKDVSQTPEVTKAMANMLDNFIRSGGSEEEWISLETEANDKLLEFQFEALQSVSETDVLDESARNRMVAIKYNKWLSERNRVQQAEKAKTEDNGIKTGSSILNKIESDLYKFTVSERNLPEEEQWKKLSEREELNIDKFTKGKEDEILTKDIEEFNSLFFNKNEFSPIAFYDEVNKNSSLMDELGITSRMDTYMASAVDNEGVNQSLIKDNEAKVRRNIIESLKSKSQVTLFEAWRKTRKAK